MQTIKLPSNKFEPDGVWRPRPHQQAGFDYLRDGGKRLVEIDHRRAGKDELALAWAAVAMHQKKPISIWHMLPEAAQARKAIWNALDANRGKRRIDLAFPPEIRAATRQQDMFIEFKNGSTWQVVGSDNFDSLVGSQPSGIVYSEFALANPYSWSYLRPILLENNGWAMFITTPRGRNHAHKLFQLGLDPDNDWLSVMNKATETGIFTDEQLKAEEAEYIATYGAIMGQSLFNQEYLCDWAAAVPGAYWGKELDDLEKAGRLTDVPYDPDMLVVTSDDLGAERCECKVLLAGKRASDSHDRRGSASRCGPAHPREGYEGQAIPVRAEHLSARHQGAGAGHRWQEQAGGHQDPGRQESDSCTRCRPDVGDGWH